MTGAMEFLKYAFMQRALLGGALIGLLTGFISFFITSRNLAFLGEGISHIAFGGLALGVLLGFDPMIGAVFFAGAAGLGIARISVSGTRAAGEDTSIGILVSFSMALGVVLLSMKKGYTSDLFSFLFGSILTVRPADILIVACVIAVLAPFFYYNLDKYLLLIFDREYARALKIPVNGLYTLLILAVVATIMSLIKITGVILVTGLLVFPGASAYLVAGNYRGQILISILVSFTSITFGLILAYYLDGPAGATIVLVNAVIFLLFSALRGIKKLFS